MEPAGGSCSDLKGQGHRSPGHWVQRGGNIQKPEHTGEGCEDGYFSLLRSEKCRSPPSLSQSAPKIPRQRISKYSPTPPPPPLWRGRVGVDCAAWRRNTFVLQTEEWWQVIAKVTQSDPQTDRRSCGVLGLPALTRRGKEQSQGLTFSLPASAWCMGGGRTTDPLGLHDSLSPVPQMVCHLVGPDPLL